MATKREWTPVNQSLPDTMISVLITDKNNQMHKAFINLGGIWIRQNTNSLSSSFYKDESSVLAWMPLPPVYKKHSREGWILTAKTLPKPNEPVFVSTDKDVFISHCRSGEGDMWWLKNACDDNRIYISKPSALAWMPLPPSYLDHN